MNGLVSKINCSLSLCALDRNSTGLKPVVFLFSQEREDHAWKSSVVSFLTLIEDFFLNNRQLHVYILVFTFS